MQHSEDRNTSSLIKPEENKAQILLKLVYYPASTTWSSRTHKGEPHKDCWRLAQLLKSNGVVEAENFILKRTAMVKVILLVHSKAYFVNNI